jgi:Arc/MetJ-type ribon-helix-helix transcriptional regulator
METVTFRLQEDVVEKIDSFLRPLHFSNRTEFIREAIRDKLNQLEKDQLITALETFKGSAKKHLSDEKLEEIRESVGKEYAKKFGIKLN